MARPAATIAGYPPAQARVIQAAPGYAQGSQAVPSGAQLRQAAQPSATRPLGNSNQGLAVGGVRPARVISSNPSGAISPAVVGPASRPAGPKAVAAPRMVQTGSVLQQSGGVVRPAAVANAGARPAASIGGNIYTSPQQTQNAYEAKHKEDPQLRNLKDLRKTCGLKNVQVNECLQVLKGAAVDGKLTRHQFLAAYKNVVPTASEQIQHAVFDLFDRDDNGVLDMMELICGTSLLCTGNEEDKINAVFNVFDENGDGVISMDEMFKFLNSVFKVVLTPNVMGVLNSMGVNVESAEDLASVTALECFKTADLDHDGRLSVDEFKSWFFAPRNDPSFLFSPVRKLLV